MQHQQFQQAEAQRSSTHKNLVKEITNQSRSLHGAQQQATHTYDQRLKQQDLLIRESATRLHADQLSLQGSIENLGISQQRLEIKLDTVTAAQIASATESEVRRSITSASTSIDFSRRLSSIPPAQIQTRLAIKLCANSCTCVCHSYKVRRTPGRLQDFFGSLFWGYSGIPMITPACDNTTCARGLSPKLLLMYVFPAGLLARAFLLVARLSLSHGFELCIRLPRIVHISANVWTLVSNGDIESVRVLLQDRVVTPFDIEGENGCTALMVRSRSSDSSK